jgi:hypothetical protein
MKGVNKPISLKEMNDTVSYPPPKGSGLLLNGSPD